MNISQSIKQIFPNANQLIDFVVQDDSNGNGPYIAQWNLTEPQPTEEELQVAWAAFLATEAVKPIPETDAQKIEVLKAENTQLKTNGIMTMEAIAEVYEMLQALQGGG